MAWFAVAKMILKFVIVLTVTSLMVSYAYSAYQLCLSLVALLQIVYAELSYTWRPLQGYL